MEDFSFLGLEALLSMPNENTPFGFFRLLLSDEILQFVVDETNINAENIFLMAETKTKSRITEWRPVTVDELLIFLGIFLHMGIVRQPRMRDYWKNDPLFKIQGISSSMSRNRFLIILRALHFSRNPEANQPKPEDRLYKIRSIISFFNKNMTEVFSPGCELSLDESMVLFRGRLIFKQYIKNKKHKYGFKLYMLTNPRGIVQKFAVYTGMLDDLGGKGHSQKIVMHLLEDRLNLGHHVYMDNYYNSFDLARNLLDKKTHCTGTLRSNRKNTPQAVTSTKLNKGQTVAKYAKGVMIGKWRDKRDVLYISNKYENVMVEMENRRKEKVSKPQAILEYNKYMSGVDHHDQMLSYYLHERKTIRWPKKLFFHIIEMIMTNSFHLYNKYSGQRMSSFDFRMAVIKSLLPPMMEHGPRIPANREHELRKREHTPGKKQIARKRCKLCAEQYNKRTDTSFECIKCPGNPGYCLNCSIIIHK